MLPFSAEKYTDFYMLLNLQYPHILVGNTSQVGF